MAEVYWRAAGDLAHVLALVPPSHQRDQQSGGGRGGQNLHIVDRYNLLFNIFDILNGY